MSTATNFPSATEARANFKGILDAASQGRLVTINRADHVFAVMDAGELRESLAGSIRAGTQVAVEHGVWVGVIPGLPIAVDGDDLEDLTAELVQALREYAEDWSNRLSRYVNHRQNRLLVQLVQLSTDEQLAEWLSGE